jgi:uncharacterized protein YutE (UPF0331/DUF86 family)
MSSYAFEEQAISYAFLFSYTKADAGIKLENYTIIIRNLQVFRESVDRMMVRKIIRDCLQNVIDLVSKIISESGYMMC